VTGDRKDQKYIQNFGQKPEGKIQFGRLRNELQNIKRDLKE
jgi:hypothetical protein